MQLRLFQLGTNHLLLNGDSTDADHLAILHSAAKELGIDKAEICLTDPPYGMDIYKKDGNIANNDTYSCKFVFYITLQGLKKCFTCRRYLAFSCGGSMYSFLDCFKRELIPVKNVLVWIKHTLSLGFSEFRGQNEFIVYAGNTDSTHRNKSKGTTTVFFSRTENDCSKDYPWKHPTMKPIKLLRDLLDATTIVGDVIIDPFAGTGSSLVAAHRTGRKWLGVELDPKYCIATLMRYRYETAKQSPVYEIIDGQRVELSDEELEQQFQEYKAQQSA